MEVVFSQTRNRPVQQVVYGYGNEHYLDVRANRVRNLDIRSPAGPRTRRDRDRGLTSRVGILGCAETEPADSQRRSSGKCETVTASVHVRLRSVPV